LSCAATPRAVASSLDITDEEQVALAAKQCADVNIVIKLPGHALHVSAQRNGARGNADHFSQRASKRQLSGAGSTARTAAFFAPSP
jgi:hypothetical protein